MSRPEFQNESKNNQYLLGYSHGLKNASREWEAAIRDSRILDVSVSGVRPSSMSFDLTPRNTGELLGLVREIVALAGVAINPRRYNHMAKQVMISQFLVCYFFLMDGLEALADYAFWVAPLSIAAGFLYLAIAIHTYKTIKRDRAEIARICQENNIDNQT